MDLHPCGNVARWIARTLGLLYFAFMGWFIIAHAFSPEGLPLLWRLSVHQQLDAVALFLVAAGGVVGWKWEGAATIIVLFGTTLWLLLEGRLLWPPGLSLLIGVLYAFAWWSMKRPFAPQRHAMQ